MIKFLQIILFIFLISYLLKWLFGFLIRRWLNKMAGQNGFNANQYHNRPEGDVKVENKQSANNKRFTKDDGDYVDYEEVKD